MPKPANEPPSDSDETFGARLMRESIEDNEARRAEERMEPPSVSAASLRRAIYDALVNYDYDEGAASDLTDHVMEWIETNAYAD